MNEMYNAVILLSRLEAFENMFFGWMSAEIGSEVSLLNKKLFYQFYIENLERSLHVLPSAPGYDSIRSSLVATVASLKSSLESNFD